MPNINFGETIQGRYVPIDLKGIDTALVRSQERFDLNNAKMAEQMGAAANIEYIDPIAREQAMQRFETRYSDLAKKYNGNLQNATPEVLRSVYTNMSDPWFNVNKHQVNQAQLEEKAATVYGADAIKLSDVRNQKLVDPATGQIRSTQDPSLMANVLKAADYEGIASNITKMMKPDQYAKLLKRFKGDPTIEGFLTTGSFGGLSEKKILEIVNDPALSEVFKSMASTYQVDNRANVGYDPESKTNMFTRELSAEDKKRFKTPIAKYLYGVSKQMKNYVESNDYMQDPLYIDAAKRAAREEELKKMFVSGHTEEKQDISFQGMNSGYTPTWGKDGNIETMSLVNDKTNPFREPSAFEILGKKTRSEAATSAQKELKQTIQNYRTNFNLRKDLTDEQVYNNFLSKTRSIAYKGLEVQPDRAANMLKNFKSGAANLKVSVNGSEPLLLSEALDKFDLGNMEGFFTPANGVSIRSYTGFAPDPKTGNMSTKQATVSGSLVRGDKAYNIAMVTDNVETQSRFINPNLMIEAMRTAKPQKSESTFQGMELTAIPFVGADNNVSSVMMPTKKIRGVDHVFAGGTYVKLSEATRFLSANATRSKASAADYIDQLKSKGIAAFSLDDVQEEAIQNQFYAQELGGSAAMNQQSLATKYFLENTDSNQQQATTE